MADPPPPEPPDRPALGADLVIPVLAAGFTIYFLVTSAGLVWEARANGTVIGVTLLALIAFQLGRIAIKLRAGRGTLGLGELGYFSSPAQRRRGLLIAILILYIALIPWLGTTLGLFLVMAASMAVLGVRAPKLLVGASAGTAIAIYLLFIAFLQTRLPLGPVEHLLNPLFRGG
ncbi:MAG TPA: hypothetical protein VM434_18455 [Beijerinckiaceae bacterium]|nr:hypothetical protein [Beijerinckiaceae bacterium]